MPSRFNTSRSPSSLAGSKTSMCCWICNKPQRDAGERTGDQKYLQARGQLHQQRQLYLRATITKRFTEAKT